MRGNYAADAARIGSALAAYESAHGPLVGISDPDARAALIEQIIDSEQRVLYFQRLESRALDPESADPESLAFDPLRAALKHRDAGDFDEAVWLVFLFVHFGKHPRAGWRYARDVYGALGQGEPWTWERTASDPTSFRFWLDTNQAALISGPGPRGFSNHRKYESLHAWSDAGTGSVVQSYVDWVLSAGGDHAERFSVAVAQSPEEAFDELYRSMAGVRRFGRVARFDYLNALRNLNLVDLRPPHSYIVGATGPLRGARLLVNGDNTSGAAGELQKQLSELSRETGLTPNVIEDAICNWQKSPAIYVRFSG
ncbi:hypothetical protein ABCS02_33250 [Microbacterium sp. X-17]|uniref:alpha-glutamyl/putrescinyl thymine pyrophosphorylase clade 3 protein n=1 Tax=Microbacterium sp. X-17 TaxID=3144404 RepID=UPI0031F49B68